MKYTFVGVVQITLVFILLFFGMGEKCTPDKFIIGLLILIIINQWVIYGFKNKSKEE